jgi:hypothetical protein
VTPSQKLGMHLEEMGSPDGPGRRKAGHTRVLPVGLLGPARQTKESPPTTVNIPVTNDYLALSSRWEMYLYHGAATNKEQ